MTLEYRQDLKILLPHTVDDPVVPLEHLADVRIVDLGHDSAALWKGLEVFSTVDDLVDHSRCSDRTVACNELLHFGEPLERLLGPTNIHGRSGLPFLQATSERRRIHRAPCFRIGEPRGNCLDKHRALPQSIILDR